MNRPVPPSKPDHALSASDLAIMRHCIELSEETGRAGEFPFASVIGKNGRLIAVGLNHVRREADVTRHAELIAVSEAQKVLGKGKLKGYTLYSSVEPCAMCSFPLRESRISRVVCAIPSRLMGGYSKFGVLTDSELSRVMPEAFGPPPEVIVGVLYEEAVKVWRRWNPLVWTVISRRGCFGYGRDRSERSTGRTQDRGQTSIPFIGRQR
jgi:tRNA(adenine34) deaminase